MNNIFFSIIMPLYNAQQYLSEAIECVLGQTYSCFELICVNDGSSDDTLETVKRYAHNDDRLVVISNDKREGAAFSRNIGINKSRGEYITFWDGDDCFDPFLLEECKKVIDANNPDIVVYKYGHIDSSKMGEKLLDVHDEDYEKKFKMNYSLQELDVADYLYIPISPCNKVFRRQLIIDNNIRFQSLQSSNDVFFSEMALIHAQKIMDVHTGRVMLYARDHHSNTRISSFRDPMCVYKARLAVRDELLRNNLLIEYSDFFYLRVFTTFLDAAVRAPSKEKADEFLSFLRRDGLANILSDEESCSIIKPLIKQKIYAFLGEDCSLEWVQKQRDLYDLDVYFDIRGARFFNTLRIMRNDGKRIALWGMGKRGKYVEERCHQEGVAFDKLIDASDSKWGDMCHGNKICAPSDIEDVDIILFSTKKIFDEMASEICRRGKIPRYITEMR